MAKIETTIKLNDQFSSAIKGMSQALNVMVSGLTKTDNKLKTAFKSKDIHAMRTAMAQTNVAIQNMTKSQEQYNQKLKQSSSNANALWGKLKSLAGMYMGWQTVKGAVNAGDTYANNTARLGLLTNGDKETAALQQKIYEASQRSLTNYNDMTNAVAKLGITAKQAFSSNEEIVAFTEILNKQFKVAGTGAQEASAAMYQLTQAMAAGKLQGDEFRSILENAPMLAQAIAKEMGVGTAKLKEMSAQGKITASIIKNALFNTADEVDKMYQQLPMTFGGMWTQVVNKINKGLEGLWQKLGKLWSSEKFQKFVDVLTNGFIILGNAVVGLMDVFSTVFGFLYDNWDVIISFLIPAMVVGIWKIVAAAWAMVPPLVASAIAWLAINWPILVIGALIAGLVILIKYMGWTFSEVCGAIAGAITWVGALIWNIIKGIYNVIITICGAIIAIVVTMVAAIVDVIWNAIKLIYNAIVWVVGVIVVSIWNAIKFVGNIISGVCQFFVNSWLWVSDNFSIICSNIGVFFHNLWQSCTIAFYKFLDAVLSGLELLAKPITFLADLFGMDLGGAFDNMHAGLNKKIDQAEAEKKEYGKLKEFKPIDWSTYEYTGYDKISDYTADLNFDLTKSAYNWAGDGLENIQNSYAGMTDLSDAFDSGYNWGSGAADKLGETLGDMFSLSDGNATGLSLSGANAGMGGGNLGNIGNAMKNANSPLLDTLDNIDKNTAATASSLSKEDEDISYMRDLAEQEAINRYTMTDLKVEFNNTSNINSKMDLDTVVKYLQDKVYEGVLAAADGVHF